MSYHLRWHDERQQILMVTVYGEITHSEIFQVFEDVIDVLDASPQPVVVIYDIGQLKLTFQIDIAMLGKIFRTRITDHPKRVCAYFANPNLRAKVVIDVARRLFPKMTRTIYALDSVAEALIAAEQRLKSPVQGMPITA
jgi:hypothetical protein